MKKEQHIPSKNGKYCFVIMPFDPSFDDVLEKAFKPAVEACGLRCVRADDRRFPAGVVLKQICAAIENSVLCVADLSGRNANVMYEVAVAHEKKKATVLVTRDDPERLPFNVRHFRANRYEPSRAGLTQLRRQLELDITATLRQEELPINLLREMLVPDSLDSPEKGKFVIAVSPLAYRVARHGGGGYPGLRPTASDYVGVRGLIQSFGLMYGLECLPDLIDPRDYMDKVAKTPVNLYCIASPKANPWTKLLLDRFSKKWTPQIAFHPDPKSPDLRDIQVSIHIGEGDQPYVPLSLIGVPRQREDFGVVIRGPHPEDATRMLMVLAGRGALGTEAACYAVTDARCAQKIKNAFVEKNVKVDFHNHKEAFYATVSVRKEEPFPHRTLLDSLQVVHVARFDPRRKGRG